MLGYKFGGKKNEFCCISDTDPHGSQASSASPVPQATVQSYRPQSEVPNYRPQSEVQNYRPSVTYTPASSDGTPNPTLEFFEPQGVRVTMPGE